MVLSFISFQKTLPASKASRLNRSSSVRSLEKNPALNLSVDSFAVIGEKLSRVNLSKRTFRVIQFFNFVSRNPLRASFTAPISVLFHVPVQSVLFEDVIAG